MQSQRLALVLFIVGNVRTRSSVLAMVDTNGAESAFTKVNGQVTVDIDRNCLQGLESFGQRINGIRGPEG